MRVVRGSFSARTFGLVATSGAAHLVIFSTLGLIPPPSEVLARHEMEFEVVEPPEPKEPEPPPPPPPEPEPERPREPRTARAAPAPEPEPTPTEAPPSDAAEEVADFTGMTLTAEGGGGWSTVVGSGGAIKGPIGKIGRGEQAEQPKAAPAAPRVVPLASLSRKPAPPVGLDKLLEKNYPPRARMQGVEGRVQMQVRLLPSGRTGDLRVVDEFPQGFDFAAACRKTLRETAAFTPGLDGAGNPVATDIKFTCSFVVAD